MIMLFLIADWKVNQSHPITNRTIQLPIRITIIIRIEEKEIKGMEKGTIQIGIDQKKAKHNISLDQIMANITSVGKWDTWQENVDQQEDHVITVEKMNIWQENAELLNKTTKEPII